MPPPYGPNSIRRAETSDQSREPNGLIRPPACQDEVPAAARRLTKDLQQEACGDGGADNAGHIGAHGLGNTGKQKSSVRKAHNLPTSCRETHCIFLPRTTVPHPCDTKVSHKKVVMITSLVSKE